MVIVDLGGAGVCSVCAIGERTPKAFGGAKGGPQDGTPDPKAFGGTEPHAARQSPYLSQFPLTIQLF